MMSAGRERADHTRRHPRVMRDARKATRKRPYGPAAIAVSHDLVIVAATISAAGRVRKSAPGPITERTIPVLTNHAVS